MKCRQEGFTLIELMIVVAVVAVLAAIAYPSYQSAVLKGKRAQGRTAILELLQQQERYMTQNNTYLAFTNSSGVTNPASVPFKTFSGDNSTGTAYQLSAGKCDTLELTECVMITATPTLTDTEADSLWAMSTGARNCSGTAKTTPPAAPPKVCWP
ncbi:type IV pilin protein [Variovorax sp. PBL-H6]|uniref:type IV pilin protein n=1 Tax=Variovorax sp. PBL-H6 TaxID=434009 RepID=UPI0013A55C54